MVCLLPSAGSAAMFLPESMEITARRQNWAGIRAFLFELDTDYPGLCSLFGQFRIVGIRSHARLINKKRAREILKGVAYRQWHREILPLF